MVYQKKLAKMMERLRKMGIKDESVLEVMSRIPRHKFISEAFEFQAYDEKALPIGYGQTISHPYTVARMTELLDISPGDRILEIGTGSGYQCAVLCECGAQVFSIEIKKALSDNAAKTLKALGYQPALRCGDGSRGWSAYAPYKAIIVTAGAPVVPEILFNQVEQNGKLLIPVGEKNKQQLILYIKNDRGIAENIYEEYQFVPFLLE
jgi:protein-L-isoaspartate(D-aspartate) O-methyltransferase